MLKSFFFFVWNRWYVFSGDHNLILFSTGKYITGICWTERLTNIEYLRDEKRMTLNVLESTKRSLLSFKFRALSNLLFFTSR